MKTILKFCLTYFMSPVSFSNSRITLSLPPENIRKPMVFWCFQEVGKDIKWVNFEPSNLSYWSSLTDILKDQEPCQTSKIERFAKIVNIFAKLFILHPYQGSECTTDIFGKWQPPGHRTKLDVHKTFRRRLGHLYILRTFNLRPVSWG